MIHASPAFPYLDMKLYYRDSNLHFRLHRKEHQELRYLNQGSTHTQACKKAISVGVFDRCCRLTSHLPDPDARVNTIFPNETWALEMAGVAPRPYPTVDDVMKRIGCSDGNDSESEDSSVDTSKLDGSSMKRESPVSKNNSNVAFNGRRLGGVRPRYQLVRLKRQGRCGRIFEIAFESPRATKEEA